MGLKRGTQVHIALDVQLERVMKLWKIQLGSWSWPLKHFYIKFYIIYSWRLFNFHGYLFSTSRGPFSIECLRCSEGDDGVRGGEGVRLRRPCCGGEGVGTRSVQGVIRLPLVSINCLASPSQCIARSLFS